jgi:hypothetical protein
MKEHWLKTQVICDILNRYRLGHSYDEIAKVSGIDLPIVVAICTQYQNSMKIVLQRAREATKCQPQPPNEPES